MTFIEAQNHKKKYGDKYTDPEHGYEFIVRIVPQKRQDFKNYFKHFPATIWEDEDAIQFSSNNQFTVMGLTSVEGTLFFHPL